MTLSKPCCAALAVALSLSAVSAFHAPWGARCGRRGFTGSNPWVSPLERVNSAPAAWQARRTVPHASFETVAEYDTFLAEMVFTTTDIRDLVLKNLDRAADEKFLAWLDKKAENSQEVDERMALKNLVDIIGTIKTKVDEAMAAEEEEESGAGPGVVDAEVVSDVAGAPTSPEPRSNTEVWQEMQRLQGVGAEDIVTPGAQAAAKISPFEGLPDQVRGSYEQLLSTLLDRPEGETLDTAVRAGYNKCDAQFLNLVKQKVAAAAGTPEAAELQEVVAAVNNVMQEQMAAATQKLQSILQAGPPPVMEKKIGDMARMGQIDDAVLLLLDANLQEAQAAGAAPAVELLTRLKGRVQMELDDKMEPEKRLMRQLLRTDDTDARQKMLHEAFRPRTSLALSDGQETTEEPDVLPPKFIQVVKNFLTNWGNIEEVEPEFASKVQAIIAEAEIVATDIYGEAQSPQERQDRMWKEGTMSVFDLESQEVQAEMKGERMPWQNDAYDNMMPNFGEGDKEDKGTWRIGGR